MKQTSSLIADILAQIMKDDNCKFTKKICKFTKKFSKKWEKHIDRLK